MPVPYSPITLGKQLRRLSFRGFIVTETEHSGGTSLPRHAHEHPNLALIRQGRFVETIGQQEWDCGPGTAIYKPSGADHANHFGSGGTKSFLVEMLPDTVARLADATPALGDTRVVRDGRIAQLTEELHHEMSFGDATAPLAIEGLVLQILAAMLRMRTPRESKAPAWLARFRSALHDRCCDAVQIAELAQECGVHPAHAIREFHRRFGTTPADYVRRLRTDRACEFLRRGMSAADAAAAAGFAHQSHFTRVLKRYHSVTPREYLAGLR